MTTIDLAQYYQPHSGQQRVHDDPSKVKCLKVGRRWGKSRAAFWELMKRYVESLNVAVPKSLVPPFHAWIVAPSFPQSRQVWTELMAFMPPEFITKGGIHNDEKMVYLKGTEDRPWGLIEVKSAHNADALQTAGLEFLWVTEAQDVSDAAFQKLLPTLRSPDRMGYALYEGIPSLWADHWFHKLYVMAQQRDDQLAVEATAFDNPLLTDEHKAEITTDRELLPDRVWRRMYLAEFSDEAGYFRNVDQCIAGDVLAGPVPMTDYVAGLDLGRKVDPSVLMVLDAKQRAVVYHAEWGEETSWPVQRSHVVSQVKHWGISRIVIDATGMGGDIFTQELMEAEVPVEPYIFTQASREALLQKLLVSLEREQVHFPPISPLLRQIKAFQFRKLPSGNYRAEAPPGEHDDQVFALALGLTACVDPVSTNTGARRFPRRTGRYVPTQSEANNGVNLNSFGKRFMRERKLNKIRERQATLGI